MTTITTAAELRAAWHDATCPEGPECRSLHMHRLSHDAMVPVLQRFLAALPDQPPATAETAMAYDLGVQDGQRGTATVKPSVEQVATAIAFTSGPMGTHYYDYALKAARAVLALLPGHTEQEIKAEALREAADDWAEPISMDWFVRDRLRARADRIEQEG